MTEPHSISGTQLADTYQISHDSENHFLERENYCPQSLYNNAIQCIDNNKLVIIILDDAVLGKPYSQHIDLIGLSGLVNTLVQ